MLLPDDAACVILGKRVLELMDLKKAKTLMLDAW
jgi:hypothetical protein